MASWYDRAVNRVFKKKLDPNFAESIFKDLDLDGFFQAASNLWGPNELLKKVGGLKGFQKLYLDQDIYAAIDKRIAALLDTKLQLIGEDEELVEFFYNQLKPHERQLKQDFFWSVYYGYGVEQIIYDEDRSGAIKRFQREEFWRFEPQSNLEEVRLISANGTNAGEFLNQILPYGKWVLTTNNGTHSNPYGDSMASRLVMPYMFKCTSWDLWIDFAKRFANGYIHAQIEDEGALKKFKEELEKSFKSSLIVTDKNTNLTLTQPSRDSSLYALIHDKSVASINKVVLGETQTTEIQNSGSYASAMIHNDVRLEKTRADISLVEDGMNEIIVQAALVNGFITDGEDPAQVSGLPRAKLIYDPAFNLELANRDSTLSNMGVKFTKKYYVNNYGFEEDDFDVIDTQPRSPFDFSQKEKRSFLSKEDMSSYLGIKHDHSNVKPKANVKLEKRHRRNMARAQSEQDEIVSLVDRNANPPIDPDELFAAIQSSKNETELNEKLLLLFENRNNQFSEDMAKALYLSATRGALIGNPEVLKEGQD